MNNHTITTGDIIGIGAHRIACGDCRDVELVTRLLDKERVNLITCDPPYGINFVESKRELTGQTKHTTIANDHLQSEDSYAAFTEGWLKTVRPFLAKKNAAYIFASDVMLFAVRKGMEDAGFHFGQMLFWLKSAGVLSRLDYLPSHELIFYGWYKSHDFRKSKQGSVFLYPKPTKSALHPTMKNTNLMQRLILNSSQTNDIVFDPFAGSGSTGVAAHSVGRRCMMIEIEQKYCRVIIERLEKLTKEKAVLLSQISHAQ